MKNYKILNKNKIFLIYLLQEYNCIIGKNLVKILINLIALWIQNKK
jgi:hypothetical protein